MKDAKDVNEQKLREAIGTLNSTGILEAKIVIKGKTVDDLMDEFIDGVESVNDDEATELPEKTINMYNELIADEVAEEEAAKEKEGETDVGEESEITEEDEKVAEEVTKEKRKVEAEEKAKSAKAETKKDKPEDNKPGVINSILEVIKKHGPVTKEKILNALIKKFPERGETSMKNTINAQIGGNKHPGRMEREKKITFVITDKGEFSV